MSAMLRELLIALFYAFCPGAGADGPTALFYDQVLTGLVRATYYWPGQAWALLVDVLLLFGR